MDDDTKENAKIMAHGAAVGTIFGVIVLYASAPIPMILAATGVYILGRISPDLGDDKNIPEAKSAIDKINSNEAVYKGSGMWGPSGNGKTFNYP
jgi:hypothetical protein